MTQIKIPNEELLPRFWARTFRNFSWLFIGSAGKLFIGLFLTLYLARILGPEAFGQVSFALALLSYFVLLTDFGLQPLGTREIASSFTDQDRIVSNVFTFRLVLAGVSLLAILVLAPLFTPSATTRSLLIIFSFALIPMAASLGWFFKGREKMMYVSLSELIQIGSYFLLLVLVVKGLDQLSYVPVFFVGSHLLATLFLLLFFIKRFKFPRFSADIRGGLSFARLAFPIALSMFLHQIYFNFDTLMLGFLRSETEVGLYSAAYRIVMAVIAVNTVFMESIFPSFSRLFKNNPKDIRVLLNKTLSISFIVSIPVGIAGTILSRPLIILLYGTDYSGSELAFKVLIWSAVLAFLGANYGYCLVACQQQKALAVTAAIGTGANIILNFLLIPKYGILGACIATVISTIILLVCQALAFRQRISPVIPSFEVSARAILAGGIMTFVLLCIQSTVHVLLAGLIGALAYLASLAIFGWRSLSGLFLQKT